MSSGKFIIFSSTIFIVLIAVIFGVRHFTKPEADPEDDKRQSKIESAKNKKGSKKVSKKDMKLDSLKTELKKYKNEFELKSFAVDSLEKLLSQQYAIITNRETEIEKIKNKKDRNEQEGSAAKELAKTFASMEAKEMAPIINKLDDRSIIRIYKKMNSRSRKNILLALPAKRAALLSKQLMQYAKN